MMTPMLPMLLLGGAHAADLEGFDAQLYRLPVDATSTLWTDDAQVGPNGWTGMRLGVEATRRPLVRVLGDGTEEDVLSDVLQARLVGALALGGLRAAVDVPWTLRARGEGGEDAGLNDVATDLKLALVRRDADGVGLALDGRFAFPTATVDAPLGSGGPSWTAVAVLDLRRGPVLLAANAGLRQVPEVALGDLEWHRQLVLRGGVGVDVSEGAGLTLDLVAHPDLSALLVEPRGEPAEVLGGSWIRLGGDLFLRGGVGAGMREAVGAPAWRAVLALTWDPPRGRDRDGDGILDAADRCPDQAEDVDGFRDDDGCPDPTTHVRVLLEDPDGRPVPDGRISIRADGGTLWGDSELEADIHPGAWPFRARAPGFHTVEGVVTVPEGTEHEVVKVMEPLVGTVRLSVVDAADGTVLDAEVRWASAEPVDAPGGAAAIELPAGMRILEVRAEGYRTARVPVEVPGDGEVALTVELEPREARVVASAATDLPIAIAIPRRVYFETASARLRRSSLPVLDDVALLLREHPEIGRVLVVGHADVRGAAGTNVDLSRRRAEAVVEYLVAHGVDPARLEARGAGEGEPADPAEGRDAWARNRRVEFIVLPAR